MLYKSVSNCFKGILAAALIVSFVFPSCSGNDNAGSHKEDQIATHETAKSSSATTKDACSLITEEEAKTILGGAVTKGMSTATMCQYLSASEEISKAGETVSIQLQPGAASEFDSYIANFEKDLNVKTKPVAGIGDKAVFAEGQLIVSKGNDFMIVIVGRKMNEEEQIAAEKAIAQKAIERLQ